MQHVPEYVDGGILKEEIYPASRTTRWRQMQREDDPFPAGFLIGGKRFWKTSKVLDWLARQESAASDPEAEETTNPEVVAAADPAGA